MRTLPNHLLNMCLYLYRLVLGSVMIREVSFCSGQQTSLKKLKLWINGYWVPALKLHICITCSPSSLKTPDTLKKGGQKECKSQNWGEVLGGTVLGHGMAGTLMSSQQLSSGYLQDQDSQHSRADGGGTYENHPIQGAIAIDGCWGKGHSCEGICDHW